MPDNPEIDTRALKNQMENLQMQLRTFKRVFDGVVVDIRSGNFGGYKWRYYSNQSLSLPAGAWDLQFQETMKAVLSPGGVFYDVGANFGFHSLVAAALVGHKGRIYAFEPVREIAQVLKEQLELNKIRNCTWVGKAVGEINGPTTFFRHKLEAGLGTLVSNDPWNYDEVRVDCVTLDSFAKGKRAPRAIKIDVEGAEDQVIAGAQNLMSSSNPPVFWWNYTRQERLDDASSSLKNTAIGGDLVSTCHLLS